MYRVGQFQGTTVLAGFPVSYEGFQFESKSSSFIIKQLKTY
jgi:hypothetical protein